jgi:hypothetical protein
MLAVALSQGVVKLVDPETGVQTWETPPTAPSGMTSAVMSPSGAFVASEGDLTASEAGAEAIQTTDLDAAAGTDTPQPEQHPESCR